MSLLLLLAKRFWTGLRLGSGVWDKLKTAFGFVLISYLRHLTFNIRTSGKILTVTVQTGSDVAMFIEVFADEEYKLTGICPKKIIDLGANAGLASLYFSSRYDQASILAVEPDPQNYDLLAKNVAGHKNIRSFQGAVSNVPGDKVLFSVPGQGMSSSFYEKEGGGKNTG
ncbi:MAG: FkbM family methyltransferase [Verrucomicrobiota bacterium]|nr:FkbM family methyltransferase [Verrucomicrobiota bacterium]